MTLFTFSITRHFLLLKLAGHSPHLFIFNVASAFRLPLTVRTARALRYVQNTYSLMSCKYSLHSRFPLLFLFKSRLHSSFVFLCSILWRVILTVFCIRRTISKDVKVWSDQAMPSIFSVSRRYQTYIDMCLIRVQYVRLICGILTFIYHAIWIIMFEKNKCFLRKRDRKVEIVSHWRLWCECCYSIEDVCVVFLYKRLILCYQSYSLFIFFHISYMMDILL